MPVRIQASKDLSLFKKITYPILRGVFFFLFSYLAYKPVRRVNKPNLAGPILWTSSHSNFLCDAVVAGYECPRPVRFLGKATLFRFPLKIFLDYCGVLPLVRAQDLAKFDAETRRMQNRSSFKAAIAALKEHWPVAIFPEGTSLPVPGLILPLKPGVAKLALLAEEEEKFSLGLRIIPVGLEYGSRDRIASGLTIRYGKPIVVRDYKELSESAPDEALAKIMEDLTEEMIRVFPHFYSEESLTLGTKLVATGLVDGKYSAAQLFLQHKNNPKFEKQVSDLMQELEEKSKEESIPLPAWGYRKIWKKLSHGKRWNLVFAAFAGLPIALWHLAFNTLPEYLLRGAMDLAAADEAEQMSIRFLVAPLLLPITYVGEFWVWQNKILEQHLQYSFGGYVLFAFVNVFSWYLIVYWKRNIKMLFSVIVFYRRQERTGSLKALYKKISLVLVQA